MNPHDIPRREVRDAAEWWPDEDMEVRASGLSFSGYAARFGRPSEPLPWRETIRPGAFAKSLSERRDVKLLHDHQSGIVLGSRRAGTMEVEEDDRGLPVRAELPDNEWGRPVRDALARRDISGMSFGFQTIRDEWNADYTERELVEVRLFEVSIVAFPAYPSTSATVRRLADAIGLDDGAPLLAAFRALASPDARLTTDQRDLLMGAINARTDEPLVPPLLARHRELLAARA